ncbi:MAG: PDDEXK nuclease domain-containing protein [Synergistaceae bacterium]|jgi:predicted nuclease of restriction endonuclease-like (RecB) superfamily|nr:PDDEXK nuclease domain-containing protein [Synergistaceae bacterium]
MNIVEIENTLYSEVKALIEQSRQRVAAVFDTEITLLYWNVGRRLKTDILSNGRAEYGERILDTLSARLTAEYGKGWSHKQLRHCIQLSSVFSDEKIFSALRRKLNWTSIKTIMYIDDPLKRDFYIEMCAMNHWSTRLLRERINSMLFERTAISRKPDEVIARELELLKNEKKLSADLVFHDPYFLDYCGLVDVYSEKDLESAIIAELARFIIELGSDFAFLARQKRITIDNRDYYIDLLFFHRRLRCLVAIDLKLSEFEAAYKGQMELYLRWLEKHEMTEEENPPIGLILCSGKNEEHIELLQLNKSNIRVADYLTKLPDMKVLEAKLKQSIARAKHRLERTEDENALPDQAE